MGWYEDVFSKGGSSTGQDLGSFNYETEQDKIKRKRALAASLQQGSMQSPKGEFIRSGDFIGYAGGANKASIMAQLAQAALAAYANKSIDSEQSGLNQTSMDALKYNLDNKPWEQRLAETKQPEAPAIQSAGAVQPTNPEVQASPVGAVPPSTARPLGTNPDGTPSGASLGAMVAGKGPSAVPTTGGPSTFVGNGQFNPLKTPQSGLTPDMVKAAGAKLGQPLGAGDMSALGMLGGMGAPAPQALAPQAQPQPTPPAGPQAMPSMPSPMPTAPQGPVPQAMPQAAPQTMPSPVPQAQQPAPQAQPQGPSMSDQMAYLQRIANSGPMGQQAAQALQAQMMAKPQLQHVTVKNDDGSESIVAFDPSGRMRPQVVYQPQSSGGPTDKQLKRDEFAGKSFGEYSKAQDELNQAQQQYGKVQNAREMLQRYAPSGGVFSAMYNSVAKALGNDQANALDMALKDLAFSDLRSTFGGNPTEGERKAQMDVKASIERGLAPSLSSLDTLSAGIERRMRSGAQQVEYWKGMNDQYRTQGNRSQAAGMADSLFPVRR